MSAIIQAEGLGKKYILSHQQKQSYYALRDVMAETVKRWGNKIIHPLASRRKPDPTHEEFWALKDVSFEINQGDRVGIIGRNGAGKSTLLKILSRITEPTKGQVSIHGRMASLLEVGTGFHPELTGRENVYLNGAILGMSRAEIKRKFDEIVAFAEVEKFLDTPVKRYSSGMYVRLAFAIAAHLEPEILVIDEVLAVGDAQFQKKCLGKMEEAGKEGRTVLFVSHNMGAIRNLCTRAILLQNGETVYSGDPGPVISKYNENLLDISGISKLYGIDNFLEFIHIGIKDCKEQDECNIDGDINIEVTFKCNSGNNKISPNINIYDENYNMIFCTHQIKPFLSIQNQKYTSTCKIPRNLLKSGIYYADFAVVNPDPIEVYIYFKQVLVFTINETWTGETARGLLKVDVPGIISPLLEWKTELV